MNPRLVDIDSTAAGRRENPRGRFDRKFDDRRSEWPFGAAETMHGRESLISPENKSP